MFPVYGEKCLSHRVVHNWIEKLFKNIRKSQMMPDQVAQEEEEEDNDNNNNFSDDGFDTMVK
jgi:hypothetical protein